MCEYGYARVSSKDQNLDRQIEVFRERGIDDNHIFMDKQSGKDFERQNYKRLVRKLKAGDILYIKELDRLGRNYEEIIEQWKYLTHTKQIDIVVLDMELLDTRNSNDLMHTFIINLVLEILSFVAQKERESNKIRQAEGIRIAKEKGITFDRPQKCCVEDFMAVYNRYGSNDWQRGCKDLQISKSTYYRYVRRYVNNEKETA